MLYHTVLVCMRSLFLLVRTISGVEDISIDYVVLFVCLLCMFSGATALSVLVWSRVM